MSARKRKNTATDADAAAAAIPANGVVLRRSTRQKTTRALPQEMLESKAPESKVAKAKVAKAKAAKAKIPKAKEPKTRAPQAKAVGSSSNVAGNKSQRGVSTGSNEAEVKPVAVAPSKAHSSTHAFSSVSVPSAKEGGKPTHCLFSYSKPPTAALLFTHGAGGDLSAAAMVNFSEGFAASEPNLGLMMFAGSMNLKGRAATFDVVKQHELTNGNWKDSASSDFVLAYGGRSMGARAAVIASHSDNSVKALVLASYPLIGPKDVRDQILYDIAEDVDVLFISGENDSMCDLKMLHKVRGKMKATTWFCLVEGADHGMNVRGGKNVKEGTDNVGNMTGKVAAEWLRKRDRAKGEMSLSWEGEERSIVNNNWSSRYFKKE